MTFPRRQSVKPRRCPECGIKYVPARKVQPTCGHRDCETTFALKVVAKAERNREKVERANDRQKREQLKTRSQWMKEAQIAFNAFIRARDAHKPCICCGYPLALDAVGGGFDCGHYRSVGSAPHLRFDERNAHGQRKQCNRYGGGRAVDYRIGLLLRFSVDFVESLEADQEPKKFTIEDLKAIKALYVVKLKELRGRDNTRLLDAYEEVEAFERDHP